MDGNLVKLQFFEGGRLNVTYNYFYDEQGFKTRSMQERRDGTRKQYDLTREESIQDKLNDRRFSVTTNSPNAKVVYDRDGNESEMTSGLNTYVYIYGRDGFVAEIKQYLNNRLEAITRLTYETDEHGNWIKQYRTMYLPNESGDDFTPVSVVYRDITYYQ